VNLRANRWVLDLKKAPLAGLAYPGVCFSALRPVTLKPASRLPKSKQRKKSEQSMLRSIDTPRAIDCFGVLERHLIRALMVPSRR
jgi:hypothetical protein